MGICRQSSKGRGVSYARSGQVQDAPRRLQVFLTREVGIERWRFNQRTDPPHEFAPFLCEQFTVQKNAAAVWTEQPKQEPDCGRLPSAVRT
jgi:hypothetical protein